MKEIISAIRHSSDVDNYTKEQREFLWAIAERLEAAHAQRPGRGEAVGEIVSIDDSNFISMDDDTLNDLSIGSRLYTHPIGSVPDEWRLIEKPTCYQLANGNEVVATLAGPNAEENAGILARLLTTTPQPADNWIKCSDRLPGGPDGDFNEDVWAYDKALRKSVMTCWADLEMVPEYTHWMPTGLKRPNPPAEGEE